MFAVTRHRILSWAGLKPVHTLTHIQDQCKYGPTVLSQVLQVLSSLVILWPEVPWRFKNAQGFATTYVFHMFRILLFIIIVQAEAKWSEVKSASLNEKGQTSL